MAIPSDYPLPIRDNGLLAGAIMAFLLYGLLLGQIFRYVASFPNDSWQKKVTVAAVFLVSTFDISLAIAILRLYFIVGLQGRSNWNSMSILFVLQQFKVCVMMAIAHIFFGKRLWMLKARPRWLKYTLTVAISVVTLLGTTYTFCILVLALGLPMHGHGRTLAKLGSLIPYVWMISVATLDLSLTGGLILTLHQSRSEFEEKRLIAKRIIRLTIESMILSHAIAVTYLALWCSSQSSTDAWWALVQTVSMSYALSILVTLNGRKTFREKEGNKILSEGLTTTRVNLISNPAAQSGVTSIRDDSNTPKLSV